MQEAWQVDFAYKNQSVARLVAGENMLLLAVQSNNDISSCLKSVDQCLVESILLSCFITNVQKLQRTKPARSEQREILRLDLLSISFTNLRITAKAPTSHQIYCLHKRMKTVVHEIASRAFTHKMATFKRTCSHHYHLKALSRQSVWAKFSDKNLAQIFCLEKTSVW